LRFGAPIKPLLISRENAMTSMKKIESNKRNAQLSTGPRSEKGKLRSRLNAVTNGLFAVHLLPGEDPAEYEQLCNSLEDHYNPVGPIEVMMMQWIAGDLCRYARVVRAEYAYLDGCVFTEAQARLEQEFADNPASKGSVPKEEYFEIEPTQEDLDNAMSLEITGAFGMKHIEKQQERIMHRLNRHIAQLSVLQARRIAIDVGKTGNAKREGLQLLETEKESVTDPD
jgi:hypothetical protein